MKHIFVRLILMAAVGLVPLAARAQFNYTVNNGAATVTGYTGGGGAVTIPSTLGGYPVTAIGYDAFDAQTAITSLTIPNSVTSIGQYGFGQCLGLTSVTIGNSVTNIDSGAFYECSGLTSVTIPNSVTSIGSGAFYECSHLTSIAVDASNPNYASMGGVLFNKTLATLIEYPGGLTGTYTIPNSVTSIGYEAFGGCSGLTSVTIPNSVTSISDYAFYSCSGLTSVTIPNGVTSIGNSEFEFCSGLTSVTIPNSVTYIGNSAFDFCSGLTSVTIPSSVTYISLYAFSRCSHLTSIAVNAANPNYASAGGVLFNKTLATLVQYPGGLTGSYTIPNSVTSIGYEAFYGCSGLTSVTIPNSVTSISDYAFDTCSGLTKLLFLGNAPSLGNSVFQGVSTANARVYYISGAAGWSSTYGGLTTIAITLPSITTQPASQSGFIGGNATFNVTATGTATLGYQWFFSNAAIAGANGASYSMNNLTFGNAGNYFVIVTNDYGSVTSSVAVLTVSPYTFVTNNGAITITGYDTNAGANVTIPVSLNTYPVVAISAGAFYSDTTITNVTIFSGVTNIGANAFQYCSNLTSVAISANVTGIGAQAFEYCSSLTNIAVDIANPTYASVVGVLFNKSLTTLIQYPGGLAGSYVVPNGVTVFANLAFAGSLGLTNVTVPGSVANLNQNAFLNCANLHQAFFQGNAPTHALTPFSGETGTLYYVSGSTGWSSTFGGWTTVAITLPSISTQPVSQSVNAGGNVTFAVSASGTATLGYQWYFTNAAIGGANSSSYSLNNVNAGNAGNYQVVVTNNFGSVTSSVATLTVTTPFTFVTNSGAITITGYSGTGGAVAIPASINGYPVTGIGVTAFANNTTITSLIVSNGVLNIADAAFNNCTALTNVVMANSVTNIGNSSFAACTALASFTGGTNVVSLGQSAFNGDAALSGFTFSSSLASVGSFTFFNCTSLKSITLPASLTQLGDYMFDNCSGVTNLTLGNTVANIGTYTFGFCSSLTSLTVPGSVTNLSGSAFYNCANLHQAYFQGNAPTVNGAAGSADSTVFAGETGTVFYLPNTTGWGTTFGGWPTAGPYQPQPQILGAGQGFVQNNVFGFTTFWATNASVVVQVSTNLLDWTPIITNALVSGTNVFTDSTWTNYPQRFYRVQTH